MVKNKVEILIEPDYKNSIKINGMEIEKVTEYKINQVALNTAIVTFSIVVDDLLLSSVTAVGEGNE